MSAYVPTIGLEVHAELKTKTKMFCSSKNDASETRPNVNVCPVCLAHPGTLPVINREAVRSVLRVGVAVGATLADYTEFDRKNYFYPDLPKGYQISQYAYPLVAGGSLNGVALTRIHLEEDTASSIHDDATGETMIDFNRSGVPLMELVTEPVMHGAAEASSFARELQLLLRYLGVSDADMEKGQMRVEANVSVAKPGERATAYVEIKNLNSFKAMERAVEHEIKRQTELIESGGRVVKQTLGWDENKQATFPQRTKEGAADYRYFPDPDLPSLKLSDLPEMSRTALEDSLPEIPSARRARYVQLGIREEDAELFIGDARLGGFFDAVSKLVDDSEVMLASNYIANDIASKRDVDSRDTQTKPEISISPKNFASLVAMISAKKISSRAAKDLIDIMIEKDDDPETLAKERGLLQMSDVASLSPKVQAVLDANPSVVNDFRNGKEAALKFLLGQCMMETKGAGNPEILSTILKDLISRPR